MAEARALKLRSTFAVSAALDRGGYLFDRGHGDFFYHNLRKNIKNPAVWLTGYVKSFWLVHSVVGL